jgi:hypothetical protein
MIILSTIFIVTLLLLRPIEFCQCILLDIHIPLVSPSPSATSGGCVRDYALLANRLLREASSLLPLADSNKEMVHLDTIHVPHVTLYLADFDLEVNNDEETDDLLLAQQSRRGLSHGNDWNSHIIATAKHRALNQTKVDMFLHTISSINFHDIITQTTTTIEGGGQGGCHLSIIPSSMDTLPSTSSLFSQEILHYYTIVGNYIMLPINNTSCLSTLSNTLLSALKQYIHQPVLVPNWVANLPEPARSAAIYRSRTYGSSNVLQGFIPHVTVGYEEPNSTIPLDVGQQQQQQQQWRRDVMEQWNTIYLNKSLVSGRQECSRSDIVTAIALGKSSIGGTVVANSNLGYWPLFNKTKTD